MKQKKSVKCIAKKPTASDVMLHQALNFGKNSGIEPDFKQFYVRRKRQTYLHKGKIRFKRRLPRKLKKKLKKEFEINYNKYKSRLIKLHGDNWMEHWISGG